MSIKGLDNIGNSCYFNAAVQCILNDSLFMNIINQEIFTRDKYCLINLIRLLKDNNSVKNVIELRRYLSQNYEIFKTMEQQDAQEALINIFDAIHKECKDINEIAVWPIYKITKEQSDVEIIIPEAIRAFQEYNNKFGYSFINTLYCGQFSNRIECTVCSHKIFIHDIFNEIYLDIPNNTNENYSIIKLFQKFLEPETLCDYKCDNCKETKTIRHKSILYMPKRLMFVINRFNTGTKNKTPVLINKTIQFQTQKNKYCYAINTAVNHEGTSQYGGHYYNDIFIENEHYIIDDNVVHNIKSDTTNNTNEYTNTNSYIVIYNLISRNDHI